jgi:hypothetical protein
VIGVPLALLRKDHPRDLPILDLDVAERGQADQLGVEGLVGQRELRLELH